MRIIPGIVIDVVFIGGLGFLIVGLIVEVVSFVVAKREPSPEVAVAEPEQNSWTPLGEEEGGGWYKVGPSLSMNGDGGMRLGPTRSSGVAFGKSSITIGSGKVEQPLKASSVSYHDEAMPKGSLPHKMVISIDRGPCWGHCEHEKFTVYFTSRAEADRFVQRAVEARMTMSGRLTWEGK